MRRTIRKIKKNNIRKKKNKTKNKKNNRNAKKKNKMKNKNPCCFQAWVRPWTRVQLQNEYLFAQLARVSRCWSPFFVSSFLFSCSFFVLFPCVFFLLYEFVVFLISSFPFSWALTPRLWSRQGTLSLSPWRCAAVRIRHLRTESCVCGPTWMSGPAFCQHGCFFFVCLCGFTSSVISLIDRLCERVRGEHMRRGLGLLLPYALSRRCQTVTWSASSAKPLLRTWSWHPQLRGRSSHCSSPALTRPLQRHTRDSRQHFLPTPAHICFYASLSDGYRGIWTRGYCVYSSSSSAWARAPLHSSGWPRSRATGDAADIAGASPLPLSGVLLWRFYLGLLARGLPAWLHACFMLWIGGKERARPKPLTASLGLGPLPHGKRQHTEQMQATCE